MDPLRQPDEVLYSPAILVSGQTYAFNLNQAILDMECLEENSNNFMFRAPFEGIQFRCIKLDGVNLSVNTLPD